MEFNFKPINLTNINNELCTKQINTINNDPNIELLDYDNTTLENYRIKRLLKIDPLNEEEIPLNLIFEIKEKWNPFSGERTSNDEIGPLCFNVLSLYDYFFKNRLKGLWHPSEDNYEGYYGNLVGSGLNISINSRGDYPEKYLFRIPILDCYLQKNHNYSIVTMGPLLLDSEIDIIDNIILKNGSKRYFIKLSKIKYYYDQALNNNPPLDKINELKITYPCLSERDLFEKYNRNCVEKLKNIIF